jgi:hypothetical protein
MLNRVDRMQLAVQDRSRAAETFAKVLGAQTDRESTIEHLNASRTVMRLGESEVELLQPRGPGPVQAYLDRWGEGLFAAGYATEHLDALDERLRNRGVAFTREADQLYLPGTSTFGFPMVISRFVQRPRLGRVSFLYEATNALNTDWKVVSARYTDLFGLDASRFCPINSGRFGYEGTLTLFDPPTRLDRIELSQTFADKPSAMRRFVERRGGDALYMCYLETHDFEGLKQHMLAAGASLTPRGVDMASERDNMWVHPKSLHGMLLGVSRTGFAWDWSGRKDLIPALT